MMHAIAEKWLQVQHDASLDPWASAANEAEPRPPAPAATPARVGPWGGPTALDYAEHYADRPKRSPHYGPSAEDRGPEENIFPPQPIPLEPVPTDLRGRVVARETVGNRIKLMISLGEGMGARVGMPGQLLTASGKPTESFTIDEVTDAVSFAFLDHAHHDSIMQSLRVVLNPSPKKSG